MSAKCKNYSGSSKAEKKLETKGMKLIWRG